MAVSGHTGVCGCEHLCRQSITAAAMHHYLQTGEYVEYQLKGES